MAYVTSTNLCYHDNMHVECSLFVDRFRWHLQYRLFQSPKYRLTVQITIYFLPRKRSLRFQHVGGDGSVILGYMGPHCGMGCKCPPPPPINHDSSLIYILIDCFNRCYIDPLHLICYNTHHYNYMYVVINSKFSAHWVLLMEILIC